MSPGNLARDLREEAKADRDRRIIELWHDGHNSLREIGRTVGVDDKTVGSVVRNYQSGLETPHPGRYTQAEIAERVGNLPTRGEVPDIPSQTASRYRKGVA